MTADFTKNLNEALAEQARFRTEAGNRRDAVGTIRKRLQEAEHEVVRARERFGRDAADDVAKGLPIRANDRLRNKMLKGADEITACKAALPAAVDAAKAAEALVAQHDRVVAAAALDVTCTVQASALKELNHAITNLRDPLAALAASAIVRDRLLGPRFANPRGVEVLGGREMAEGFIEGLPPRLRPEALDMMTVEQRAQEIAQGYLADFELKETENV